MNLERKTVKAMIQIYCRAHHVGVVSLCSECAELEAYALGRIEKCPFGEEKPVCNKCTVHCYTREKRKRVKEVMRFSGPRMLTRHPVLALRHLIRSKCYSGNSSK
ncbi:MAG: nitrous oxide-stimulated promoter family protein [Pontiella sp.]